jgi:hypothetical protein
MCDYINESDFKPKSPNHCPGLQNFTKNTGSRLSVFISKVFLLSQLACCSLPTTPTTAHQQQAHKEAIISEIENIQQSWMLVAHAYNPSYSRGRDQEDRSSKPA